MIGVTPGRGGAVCSGNGVSLRAVRWHTPYSGYRYTLVSCSVSGDHSAKHISVADH